VHHHLLLTSENDDFLLSVQESVWLGRGEGGNWCARGLLARYLAATTRVAGGRILGNDEEEEVWRRRGPLARRGVQTARMARTLRMSRIWLVQQQSNDDRQQFSGRQGGVWTSAAAAAAAAAATTGHFLQ
jgi:hypothetical protein